MPLPATTHQTSGMSSAGTEVTCFLLCFFGIHGELKATAEAIVSPMAGQNRGWHTRTGARWAGTVSDKEAHELDWDQLEESFHNLSEPWSVQNKAIFHLSSQRVCGGRGRGKSQQRKVTWEEVWQKLQTLEESDTNPQVSQHSLKGTRKCTRAFLFCPSMRITNAS